MNKRSTTTPPKLAKRWGCATKKVTALIRCGELIAFNLADRNCTRPRWRIYEDDIEAFEAARRAIPDGGESTTQKLRRRATPGVKEFV